MMRLNPCIWQSIREQRAEITQFMTHFQKNSVPFHFYSMKMNEWVSAKEGLTLLTNKSFHGKGFSRVCIKVGLILYSPRSEEVQRCRKLLLEIAGEDLGGSKF